MNKKMLLLYISFHVPNIRGKYLISTCLGYDRHISLECAKSAFTLTHLTCFYFASAIIWNKEQGKSCSKSIIICTIIHTFWQLWYARFIWTWWMHFEWCQIICFGWRRLVIYCSMLRLILFGVTHKKSSYSMYGFSLFVCLYSMFQKDEVLCISHRKPGVLLAEIVIGTAVSKKE